MSGIRATESSEFHVDSEFIDKNLRSINTILYGTITSVSGEKATVEIANKYHKQMDDGTIRYVPYGTVETNFATLTLFKYAPKSGDKVVMLVSQSDIQSFLGREESDFPTTFNLFDSVVIPIDPFYSDSSKISIGDSSIDCDVSAKDYKLTATGYSYSGSEYKVVNSLTTDNLLQILSLTFTAIGAVTVNGQTIDTLTGGVVGTNAAKILGFSGV